MFDNDLTSDQYHLMTHPLYNSITDIARLRVFMEAHVFAVWDFMSLAKRLQSELTTLSLPWTPPRDSRSSRAINEIILAEESDTDREGNPASHLRLYISAMVDIGANVRPFLSFLSKLETGIHWKSALQSPNIPEYVQTFVSRTLEVAITAPPSVVAAYFFYGREDIIPEMFSKLLDGWQIAPDSVPNLIYYLQRHIELDGDEHGLAAEEILKRLMYEDSQTPEQIRLAARQAIQARIALWDGVVSDFQLLSHPAVSKVTSDNMI
jgi:hypothetical protein